MKLMLVATLSLILAAISLAPSQAQAGGGYVLMKCVDYAPPKPGECFLVHAPLKKDVPKMWEKQRVR